MCTFDIPGSMWIQFLCDMRSSTSQVHASYVDEQCTLKKSKGQSNDRQQRRWQTQLSLSKQDCAAVGLIFLPHSMYNLVVRHTAKVCLRYDAIWKVSWIAVVNVTLKLTFVPSSVLATELAFAPHYLAFFQPKVTCRGQICLNEMELWDGDAYLLKISKGSFKSNTVFVPQFQEAI